MHNNGSMALMGWYAALRLLIVTGASWESLLFCRLCVVSFEEFTGCICDKWWGVSVMMQKPGKQSQCQSPSNQSINQPINQPIHSDHLSPSPISVLFLHPPSSTSSLTHYNHYNLYTSHWAASGLSASTDIMTIHATAFAVTTRSCKITRYDGLTNKCSLL